MCSIVLDDAVAGGSFASSLVQVSVAPNDQLRYCHLSGFAF